MPKRRTMIWVAGCALAVCLMLPSVGVASEYHGQVTFGGSPVPGATVTAMQGDKKISVVSDSQGSYFFADLPDGNWKIVVEMRFFKTIEQDVTVGATTTPGKWDLSLLPIDQIMAQTKVITVQPAVKPPSTSVVATATAPVGPKADPKPGAAADKNANAPTAAAPVEEPQKPSDGFLINGSVNNAATSQFSLAPAFGNQRSGTKSLYNGGFSVIEDNSSLDAQSYPIGGYQTAKPYYNATTLGLQFGGPLNIPHLMPRGPNFFFGYQWLRSDTAKTLPGTMPTAAERTGDLSALGGTIVNPATGVAYANNQIPVSAQAKALLALYPLPNVPLTNGINYEIPVLTSQHQDAMQVRLNKGVTRKDQLDGSFSFQDTRNSGANLFGFTDKTNLLGINTYIHEQHRLTPRVYLNGTYTFSRLRTQSLPFFAGKANIYPGLTTITGNLQDPSNFGPPSLSFADGTSGLSDGISTFNRNATSDSTASVNWYHGKHNVTAIVDFQRKEFNILKQSNPRGSFSFNSSGNPTTSGNDFADFLLGTPATSEIAFGNADKYFRQSVYALGATDDWRVRPELTINAGMRWEYGAPMTELKGRLVNLNVGQNFTQAAPVLGSNPTGIFPTSLIRPDKAGFEPRIGISWRPIAGSTLVIRAGYGVYDDTSVYLTTANLMAQQSPLSTSLNVPNTLLPSKQPCETLANGFNAACSTNTTTDTFGIDPNFRVGYANTWQVLAQRDLPGSLQGTVTYFGVKGTRGMQQFLPNSYPLGGVSPCGGCPSGYIYQTSNGDSTRESGQVQLRRRLRNGFTASVSYTYSKSIDDDSALGGQGPVAAGAASQSTTNAQVAQNWLNLKGERGLSSFDQRHLLNASVQYTSGQGIGGGSLMEGWRGTLLKEWTVLTTITAGSGLPESPLYFATVPGTANTCCIRANYTGAGIHVQSGNQYLNPLAYTAPTPGQWGNAARNSITGPNQFSLNSSLARTFRLTSRYNLFISVAATNTLNNVTFASYYNYVNNAALFGTPTSANPMRSIQLTGRLRF